jgi:DNA-binding NtrC family response regulator
VNKLPFGEPLSDDKELNDHLKRLVERLIFLGITLGEAQEEIEKLYMQVTLKSFSGNRSRTARKLGMHRNTLNSRIEKYKIEGGNE